MGIQIDPRVSADAVDVRNGLHQSARPQAVVDKKTEYVLLKKRSKILVPLTIITGSKFSESFFCLQFYQTIYTKNLNVNTAVKNFSTNYLMKV